MKYMNKISLYLIATLLSTQVLATDYEVAQKNKEFSKKKLIVNVGDTVKFSNDDYFFHNVFSISEVKTFDLGSYPEGESKSVTFDKPGIVEVECAIHPNMKMVIEVK